MNAFKAITLTDFYRLAGIGFENPITDGLVAAESCLCTWRRGRGSLMICPERDECPSDTRRRAEQQARKLTESTGRQYKAEAGIASCWFVLED